MSKEEALCVYVLAGLLIVGSVTLLWVNRSPRQRQAAVLPREAAASPPGNQPGGQQSPESPPEPQDIVVHVSGAVKSPGVYTLSKGDRVVDAVAAAGGPAQGAAVDALNLATRLEDGQKVYVPDKKEVQGGGSTGSASSAWQTPTKINLNLATREQLDSLPGIGPGLASAIIEYRQRNGGFRKPEDLMKVGGIGPKTFERLKSLVTAD